MECQGGLRSGTVRNGWAFGKSRQVGESYGLLCCGTDFGEERCGSVKLGKDGSGFWCGLSRRGLALVGTGKVCGPVRCSRVKHGGAGFGPVCCGFRYATVEHGAIRYGLLRLPVRHALETFGPVGNGKAFGGTWSGKVRRRVFVVWFSVSFGFRLGSLRRGHPW